MKIRQITIAEIKNLGNYENRTLSITGELHDGDNLDEEIYKLQLYVHHKLNADARKEKLKEVKAKLEEDMPDAKREKLEAYVAKYEEHTEIIRNLDFIDVK